jgi:hypothetical protein
VAAAALDAPRADEPEQATLTKACKSRSKSSTLSSPSVCRFRMASTRLISSWSGASGAGADAAVDDDAAAAAVASSAMSVSVDMVVVILGDADVADQFGDEERDMDTEDTVLSE